MKPSRSSKLARLSALALLLGACTSSHPVRHPPPWSTVGKPPARPLPVLAPRPPAPTPLPPAPTPPAPIAATTLKELTQIYLDGLFAAKPHLAMFMGDHRFDGKHADFSPQALGSRALQLRAQREALGKLDGSGWSADERVDADIMRDGIDLELLYLDEIRDWEWDPRLYDSFPYYDPREIVGERLTGLVHGDFAPAATRLDSLKGLLEGLPRLLEQYRTNLKRPARIYTERAIDDNRGRIDLVKGEVASFVRNAVTEGASPESAKAAEAARLAALGALEQYQAFLEQTLLPRSDGDWRLGAARYAKKFPLALQTRLTPAEVVPKAQAAFLDARRELFKIALKLHEQLLPAEPRPTLGKGGVDEIDKASQKRIIEAVRDVLSKDHPKPSEYVANEWRSLDKLRAFITKKNLLELPPASTLRTIEMPAFKRGVTAAEYLSPGMLDRQTEWRGTYSVDPIDPTWPADKVESYLRDNNRYTTELRAVHEAYPGHHVQTWYARRNLDPLRAVLWNAPMVEGWAVYGEDVMDREGLGAADNARYRFFTARGHMVVATNALLDIQLHSGQMSEAEAVRFMVEEGMQAQAVAEKKLVRAKLDTTQLCQYFLGYQEILDLERDYRAKLGKTPFKQRTFDDALVGHGSIPVKYLRRYLLGD